MAVGASGRAGHCSTGEMASGSGSGGTDTAGAYMRPSASRHGRPDGGSVGCQAVAGAALRRGRGRVRWLPVAKGQHGRGEGGGETWRLGARACKMCALGASRACTPGVQQNAKACQEAWVGLGINRSRLEFARRLVDMVVWSGDRVHNAN